MFIVTVDKGKIFKSFPVYFVYKKNASLKIVNIKSSIFFSYY